MPSGPKKRKAAKKKKESSLGVQIDDSSSVTATTIPSPGNGSDSGKEAGSPVTPQAPRFEAEEGKEKRGCSGSSGVGGSMDSSEEGGEKAADGGNEAPVIPEKGEEVAEPDTSAAKGLKVEEVALASSDSSTSSASSIDVPVSKEERVSVEHAEKGVDAGESRSTVPEAAEPTKLEEFVPVPEPASAVEQPIPISEAVMSAQEDNVPIEKVETSSSVDLSSGTKEEKAEEFSAAPREQPPESAEQQPHTETRETGTEVASPPQLVHRASWWNCCGLLDGFAGSNR